MYSMYLQKKVYKYIYIYALSRIHNTSLASAYFGHLIGFVLKKSRQINDYTPLSVKWTSNPDARIAR
jgi:hypothetical protein